MGRIRVGLIEFVLTSCCLRLPEDSPSNGSERSAYLRRAGPTPRIRWVHRATWPERKLGDEPNLTRMVRSTSALARPRKSVRPTAHYPSAAPSTRYDRCIQARPSIPGARLPRTPAYMHYCC